MHTIPITNPQAARASVQSLSQARPDLLRAERVYGFMEGYWLTNMGEQSQKGERFACPVAYVEDFIRMQRDVFFVQGGTVIEAPDAQDVLCPQCKHCLACTLTGYPSEGRDLPYWSPLSQSA